MTTQKFMALLSCGLILATPIRASLGEEKAGPTEIWKTIEAADAREAASQLVDAYRQANITDLPVRLDLDPQLAVGAHAKQGDVIVVPIRDLREGGDYPEVTTKAGCGFGIVFFPDGFRPLVEGKPLPKEKLRHLRRKSENNQEQSVSFVIVAAQLDDAGAYRMLVYGASPDPLLVANVGESPVQMRLPVDLKVVNAASGSTQVKLWVFGENWSAFEMKK